MVGNRAAFRLNRPAPKVVPPSIASEIASDGYLAERNLAPKRYVWQAKGEEILSKIKRAREYLNDIIKRI